MREGRTRSTSGSTRSRPTAAWSSRSPPRCRRWARSARAWSSSSPRIQPVSSARASSRSLSSTRPSAFVTRASIRISAKRCSAAPHIGRPCPGCAAISTRRRHRAGCTRPDSACRWEKSLHPCDEGWDPTPGIVSVWAEGDGRAMVWRRIPETGRLLREDLRFSPWLLAAKLEYVPHAWIVDIRELEGDGALRYQVYVKPGSPIARLRDAGKDRVLVLPPEEQYLVATGRTYFRGLAFDQLHRMQFDLETTGLDPARDRIFMIATRDPFGATNVLEARGEDDGSEIDLIRRLVGTIHAADPDVIENHNLHGFDLPFLASRARRLGIRLPLGRIPVGLRQRAARRGIAADEDWAAGRTREAHAPQRIRFVAPGRELIDTLDAVMRHGFSTGDLPWRGLKAVARHFGIAAADRELIPGDRIHEVYRTDPARVRRYAASDVEEVARLAPIVGGAAFALARMAPRRYERLADAGAATGVIDPMLVRAYLHAGRALPAHHDGDREPHTGAALHLFATGAARRIVKADVASLYPSLMRAYRIGPARDSLGALLNLVD